ncbi:MAG: protein-L-isoaspartate O-methyltransferase [Candidatus Altiarchaeota archaeon]
MQKDKIRPGGDDFGSLLPDSLEIRGTVGDASQARDERERQDLGRVYLPVSKQGYAKAVSEGIVPERDRIRPGDTAALAQAQIMQVFEKHKPSDVDVDRITAVSFEPAQEVIENVLPPQMREAIIGLTVDPEKTRVYDRAFNAFSKDALKRLPLGATGKQTEDAIAPLADAYWRRTVTLAEFKKHYEFNVTTAKSEGDPDGLEDDKYMKFYQRKPEAPEHLPKYFGWPEVLVSRRIEPGELLVEDDMERMIKALKQMDGPKIPERVLDAISKVPRHEFVPEKLMHMAYDPRTPLEIGEGQTVSAPNVVGWMTDWLDAREGQTVMEIGTGSGYQAAVLSHLVGPNGKVVTYERVPELAERARERLKRLGYNNIEVVTGDGMDGPEKQYDRIMVTAGATNFIPELERQLKIGGKMVLPMGNSVMALNMWVLERTGEGGYTREQKPGMFRFVPMLRGVRDEKEAQQMTAKSEKTEEEMEKAARITEKLVSNAMKALEKNKTARALTLLVHAYQVMPSPHIQMAIMEAERELYQEPIMMFVEEELKRIGRTDVLGQRDRKFEIELIDPRNTVETENAFNEMRAQNRAFLHHPEGGELGLEKIKAGVGSGIYELLKIRLTENTTGYMFKDSFKGLMMRYQIDPADLDPAIEDIADRVMDRMPPDDKIRLHIRALHDYGIHPLTQDEFGETSNAISRIQELVVRSIPPTELLTPQKVRQVSERVLEISGIRRQRGQIITPR